MQIPVYVDVSNIIVSLRFEIFEPILMRMGNKTGLKCNMNDKIRCNIRVE